MNSVRRFFLLAGLSVAMLAGCSDKPADATATGFSGIDITGADYATGFSLTDHNGQPRTLADFKGKAVVVFFGFTQCPDVCPTSLGELAQARQLLGADGERLQGLFISVDPERDTPARLGEYVHAFHKDTLAATADIPSLERFATSLGFVFQKVPGKHFDENPEDYTLEHSASLAVLDPQGRLAGLVRPPFNAPAIARDLQKLTEKSAP